MPYHLSCQANYHTMFGAQQLSVSSSVDKCPANPLQECQRIMQAQRPAQLPWEQAHITAHCKQT